MADKITIINKMEQNNIRRAKPRSGSKTGGKKLVSCRACNGTGWLDFLHISKCTTCHGTGYVRV